MNKTSCRRSVDRDVFSLASESQKNIAPTRLDDLRAYAQAYLLIWSVTILLLFEDDAAMLACMFC